LTVTGANDAPVATSHAAEVAEGQSIAGQLSARDQDSGAQLRFAAIGRPPAGFALAADGSWTLDAADAAYRGLAAGAAQIIQVPFSVTDEHGARNESFLVIAVTGIAEAPMLKGTPPALPPATEDTAFIVTQEQLLAGWSDPDGGSLVAFGLTAANATVRANADGSFTVVPAANVNGTLQLNYDVGDGFRVSAASAEVEVLAVNDPAEIGGTLSGSVTEATPFGPGVPTAGGQLSVSDPDNALQFAPLSGIRSANGYGTVTLNDAGAWQYVLDNSQASVNALGTGQTLSDSFLVHSLDGTAATVNVTINGAVDVVRQPSWFSGTGDPNDFSAPMAGGDPSAEMWDTAANDTLVGTDADQRFWSYSGGNDIIYAQGGNDRIAGLGAGGTYYGQAGDDYIQASATSTIYGGTGGDEVSGSRDGDVIYGGSGVDSLRGYGGNDIIVGGYHIDNLEGGAGQDTFRFLDLRDSGDHILDFLYGTDSLDFSALDANQQLAGDQSFAWGGSTPTANGVWVQVLSDRTSLYLDTDGNPGTAEFMLTFLNSNMASVAGLQQAPERWLL
jgi:VCBS repeat-containing protein